MENADYQLEQFCVGFKFYLSLASLHDKYTVIITFILSPITGCPVTKLHNVIAESLRSSANVMYVGPALLGLIDPWRWNKMLYRNFCEQLPTQATCHPTTAKSLSTLRRQHEISVKQIVFILARAVKFSSAATAKVKQSHYRPGVVQKVSRS